MDVNRRKLANRELLKLRYQEKELEAAALKAKQLPWKELLGKRIPEKAYSSMEGYGMVVSEVCAANDMAYYYGPCTITYVACCMLY